MIPAGARQVFVVVDLGFGDCGKGLLTDFLVRRTGASVVVRFNGGAQAGHNVVTPDGRHHTFAQVGAGAFLPGTRTVLSKDVVFHPTALGVEAAALERAGVPDVLSRVQVSEAARVITPFHQATNRIRELARGAGRHGSCGVGVGETVRDGLEHPGEGLTAGLLREPAEARRVLGRIRERLGLEVGAILRQVDRTPELSREWALFEHAEVIDRWLEQVRPLVQRGVVVAEEELGRTLAGASGIVCEGAQGVLLDEWLGFHPYTTWSTCTAEPAEALLREHLGEVEIRRVGVLRSHQVRHGPGPLPTETAALGGRLVEHNARNPWQGEVRYGWFDAVLARYALEASGGVDLLAVTHLDLVPRVEELRIATAWKVSGERIERLPCVKQRSLEELERLTKLAQQAVPILETVRPDETSVIARLEALLGRRIDCVSRGPRATDVELR